MITLHKYLADYIQHEIEEAARKTWNDDYEPSSKEFEDWIKQGLEAYQSTEGVKINIVQEQPEQQQLKKTQVGCISVDAGLVMVGDPCYHIGQDKQPKSFNKTWQEFVREELTYQDEPLNEVQLYHDSNVVGLAVVIGNFGGDGCYPVYVETNEQGQQKRLIVEF